jgi:mannosyltransferase OCH1-like enzyme
LPAQTALHLPRRLHAALLHLAKARGDDITRAGLQFHLVPPADILAPLFRYTLPEQREMKAANLAPVPRVIHQIWIGPLPVPPAVAAWRAHAAGQGYGYKLWQEADLARLGLPEQPVFASMLAAGDYPGAVDVARYAILAAEGGIYLDCDWYPARDDISFHDLMPLQGMTALAEEVPRLTGLGGVLLFNSFIACPAGHPAIIRLTSQLPHALALLPEAPAWWATGPLVFTLAARGGAVSLAPQSLIAGTLAKEATPDALRAGTVAEGSGLLIAWKSW